MHYLLKSEPDAYSFDDLLRDGETTWNGIKNPQALITLRNMKRGEICVIYHSNTGKAAVGTATVVSVHLDPADGKTPSSASRPANASSARRHSPRCAKRMSSKARCSSGSSGSRSSHLHQSNTSGC